MKVLIYSPSDMDKQVYKNGAERFKELGYEVFNPYDHKMIGESLMTTIYRLVLLTNMVICVTQLERRGGKVSKEVSDLRNFCFHNGIIFRISENDKDIHYTKWGRRKLRSKG